MNNSLPFAAPAKWVAMIVTLITLLLCGSLASSLSTYGYAQKIFYFASYLALFLVVYTLATPVNRKRLNKYALLLFIAVFALGLVQISWAFYINKHYGDFTLTTINTISNYQLGGKRLILGAFIVLVLSIYNNEIAEVSINWCKAILWVGAAVALVMGVHEHLLTGDRIRLTANVASSSSYMVMFLYCTYLWLSVKEAGLRWQILDIALIAITLSLVLLTGTRVTQLAFFFITLCQISRFYGLLKILQPKRNRLIALVIVVALAALTGERWLQGINNLENYDSDSSTSLGARVAIWDSGLHFLPQHLGYSSPDERTVTARAFIARVHPGNTEGYKNVQYNMHNEFLEIATLQGIAGLAALVFFYAVALWVWFKRSALMGVSMPVATLFIMGMTDSVLIYSPTSMMFVSALALCAIRPKLHHL